MQQILRDVPLLVFDHALAPLGSEQLDRPEDEPSLDRRGFETRALDAPPPERERRDELFGFPRLQAVGCERDVGEERAARTKDPRALGKAPPRVDVHEHVAAPDPVERRIGERQLFDRRLHDVDLARQPRFRDALARTHTVQRNPVECNRADAMASYRPPAIAGSKITVEASPTGVSRPSRVRTSSPST